MRHLAMIGLAVLVVFAFAFSTAPDTGGVMTCTACAMDGPKDKACPRDGHCARCDTCLTVDRGAR